MHEKLFAAIDKRTEDLVSLTAALIRYPTVNPPGDLYGPCADFIGERLKGSGMRWTEIGAAAVCALRCLLLGNQWDQFLCFWNQKQSGGLIGALSPQS